VVGIAVSAAAKQARLRDLGVMSRYDPAAASSRIAVNSFSRWLLMLLKTR
jgi:hypothetical protein